MQAMVYLLLSRWWIILGCSVIFSARSRTLTSMAVRAVSVQCAFDLLGLCRDEAQFGECGVHRERAAIYGRNVPDVRDRSFKECLTVQDQTKLTLKTTSERAENFPRDPPEAFLGATTFLNNTRWWLWCVLARLSPRSLLSDLPETSFRRSCRRDHPRRVLD